MTSTHDRLIHMANQIATAFHAEGEAAAIAMTADHIGKFWDPRMRAGLAAALAGEGLGPVARAAALRLQD